MWDNETGVGRRGRLVALATKVVQLPPYGPESKGIVERVNGYLETSFLPGRAFASPADFNAQLTEWLPRANARRVRGLDAVPGELISTDRAAMSALPPIAPTVGFTHRARLPRDYYPRLLGTESRCLLDRPHGDRAHGRRERRPRHHHRTLWRHRGGLPSMRLDPTANDH